MGRRESCAVIHEQRASAGFLLAASYATGRPVVPEGICGERTEGGMRVEVSHPCDPPRWTATDRKDGARSAYSGSLISDP